MNIFATVLLWFAYLTSLYFAIFWFLVFLSDDNKESRKKITKFPMVTVAVPSYNEEKTIKPTLTSVLKLDYPREKLEIIAINDGSRDKTLDKIKEVIAEYPGFDIKLINKKNGGKGAALNSALRKAKGEFFVCMDADSFVKPNALRKMLPHFDADEKIAAVLPSLKVKNPKNMLQRMQWYEYIVNMYYKELMSKLNCVHVAPGPFSVYRTGIIKRVGYFDANHNLTEDLEMALRLQSRQYRLVQLLNTDVLTIAPENLKQLYMQRNRWYKGAIINAIRYKFMMFNRKYGDFGIIQMPTIILSGMIALIMISSIIYYSIKPYVQYFYNMSFVNFDFMTFIRNFSYSFHILDLNYMTLFVAVAMLTISLVIFKKSHVSTRENILKHGTPSLFFYIFLYFLVLGTMWIGIAFDLIRGKKQRW
ncbi:glycosyltransferase [Candidatus Woesearchaeota archaeon]|nr:glycosyltransferase [Candidatus Woesearchaeota archaeon]